MRSGFRFWVPVAATVAVLGLAYGPLMWTFFVQQWARPHYQYFPFVLGAFAWLIWRNSALAQPRETNDRTTGRFGLVALLVASWGLLALAYLADSPWLALISAILLVASRFWRVAGGWRVEYLWGIWALLWLMVPLPLNRDQQLISKLQHLSSRLSSLFLDWAGVEHLMDGNTLQLPEKQFFVDEACSGIVSVMSIIACAVIYGIWRNRAPFHVILLALAGIGWATLMNVVRITTIALAFAWWGVDWSSGTSHEILGLVIFTFIFLGLVSTDYLLLALLAPIKSRGGDSIGEPIQVGAKVVAAWDWLQAWGAPRPAAAAPPPADRPRGTWELPSRLVLGLVPLLAFATLAGAQLTLPYFFGRGPMADSRSFERALALEASVLPPNVAGLQRTGFSLQERESDDVFGHHSRIYNYQDEHGNTFLVSCDFPFGPDWHDLTVCYAGIGWELREGAVRSDTGAEPDPWNYVEAGFTKPDGSAALLVYSVFDEYGERVRPPQRSLLDDFWRSLGKKHRNAQGQRLFQVQVWTTAAGTVREPQREPARRLLLQAREAFRQSVAQPAAPANSDGDQPVRQKQ